MAANIAQDLKQKHDQDATAFAMGLSPEIYDDYKMVEELAHEIAYAKLKTNDIIDVYIAGTRKKIPHIVYQFVVNHEGLVGYILCPTRFSKASGNKIDLKIIYKGTSDFASFQRDNEAGSPGHESYYENESAMLVQANGIMKNCRTTLSKQGINAHHLEFTLTILGHSLGGGDAQRFMLSCMKVMAQILGVSGNIVKPEEGVPSHDRDQFNFVKKLVLYTFNSVGVTQEVNQKAEQLAGFITSKRKQDLTKLNLEVNIFLAGGDAIQQIGDTHLLYRVSKESALVRIVKATNNLEGLCVVKSEDIKQLIFKAGQAILKNTLGKGIVAGVVCVGSAYFIGLTSLTGGAVALLSGGLSLKNWYKTGVTVYGLVAGGYGTVMAHRTCYFTQSLDQLHKKDLDQYFLSSVNDHAVGQHHIMREVQIKATTVNCMHQTYAKTSKHLAKPFKKCSSRSAAKQAQILCWQYNPNSVELKQHQDEVQMKIVQAEQARVAAQKAQVVAAHQALVQTAVRTGFF